MLETDSRQPFLPQRWGDEGPHGADAQVVDAGGVVGAGVLKGHGLRSYWAAASRSPAVPLPCAPAGRATDCCVQRRLQTVTVAE